MTARGEKLTDIDYDQIIRDDDREDAILFEINGNNVWLPRSKIEVSTDHKQVTMPEWLAIERGIV